MDQKDKEKALIAKYLQGECSEREKILVERFYLSQFLDNSLPDVQNTENIKGQIWERVSGNIIKPAKLPSRYFARYGMAAAIFLFIGITVYILSNSKHTSSTAIVQRILPGGNKAVLTLANGKKIVLNEGGDGQIASEAGVTVTKIKGLLVYTISKNKNESNNENAYNTIETHSGGKFRVVLADGTNVWLNAQSSIRYPLTFNSYKREVVLNGEGYFEVAHRNTQPFFVVTHDHTVKVLGTHFNVNTYADEPVSKTTLMQGSIQINTSYGIQLLKPGQQAVIWSNGVSLGKADLDEAMAWKNGDFTFDGEKLDVIMRKISRWYNVDVVYQNNARNVKFSGSISMSKDITDVLKVLEVTDAVHFKVTGRRVTVMP
jgi:transmembrane sensor